MQKILTNAIPDLKENDILLVLHNDAYVRFNEGDVGVDLSPMKDVKLDKHSGLVVFHTGVKTVIPNSFVGKVYSRSSTYKNTGMMLANNVGIIDPSYRGEIICPFVILDKSIFYNKFPNKIIPKHTRLAQLIIEPVTAFPNKIFILQDTDVYENIGNIFPTKRGNKGFGSSGI